MQQLKYLCVVAVLVAAGPALGQEVELAWKFKDGDKFFQTMETKTTQSMTIMGQPVKQEQTQKFVFSWTVKKASDQEIVLEQKIESVEMAIKIGSNEVKYNSTAKDAPDNPLAGFFRPLVGSSFTLTLDPKTMKVTKVEGREAFVEKVTQANPQMANLLRVILSEDQLKQMAEPAFAVVPGPGKKVKKGDSWSRESKLSMGPIGSYDAKYTYTYSGDEKRTIDGNEVTLQKIDMKTELKYHPPSADQASGLPFKIVSGNLDTTEASGTVLFDAANGRVVETSMKVNLKGKLQISVADQKADVELEQEQTTTTKTSTKNPNEATTGS